MRPKGIVRLFKRSRLVWECENLFVDSGLPALANLVAGVSAGQYVTAIGFGSGAAAPTTGDTGLSATPAYYNAIGAHSFPSPGAVQFNYSLSATDFGAIGITIQELGLFANGAGVSLPAAAGTANPGWMADATHAVGDLIVDGNGNIQRCATAGTSGSVSPAWAATLNGSTADGGVTWTLAAFHSPPAPLIAHVSVPAFAYNGAGNYAGTWTLTF